MSTEEQVPYPGHDDPDERQRGLAWDRAAERLRAEARGRTEHELELWRTSDPVLRSQAQLDAALKSLEDRGLIWWDRASNTYDLHPIVRSYVFDTLDDGERVEANVRVRDYFSALPASHVETVTSVEDLRNQITVFRALVGAGQRSEAEAQWFRFLQRPIQRELGAHSTTIELIESFRELGSHEIRVDLAFSYFYSGRHEECSALEDALLKENLQALDSGMENRINDLGILLSKSGESVYFARATALAEEVLQLTEQLWGLDDDDAKSAAPHYMYPPGVLLRARQALAMGDNEAAVRWLDRAEELARGGNCDFWYAGEVAVARLERELLRGTLTQDHLNEVKRQLDYWINKRKFAALHYEWLIDRGSAPEALLVAQEHERLERNAGLDPSPILAALPLIQLGRRREAGEVVDETLDRASRNGGRDVPHRFLAEALYQLRRQEEAVPHALEAYRLAWESGPPNCQPWALRCVRRLLRNLGVPEPELPVVGVDEVTLPFEPAVRAHLDRLREELEEYRRGRS